MLQCIFLKFVFLFDLFFQDDEGDAEYGIGVIPSSNTSLLSDHCHISKPNNHSKNHASKRLALAAFVTLIFMVSTIMIIVLFVI